MTYQELKAERQAKYEKAVKNNGVFFAFSTAQLEEGKKEYPLLEGDKYVSIGAGGFMRKSQLDTYLKDCEIIDQWFKLENAKLKKDKAEREKAILYELCNYECFYSGDIFGGDAWSILKEQGYTKQEVFSVYKKNYQLITASL